jgi:hypothetical protein
VQSYTAIREHPATPSPQPRETLEPEVVPIGVLQLLTTALDHAPAFVQSRFMDVLAANPLATALSPNFTPGKKILLPHFSIQPTASSTWTGAGWPRRS